MSRTELPWLFLGHRVRPYSLAVTCSTSVVVWQLLILRNPPGDLLDNGVPGHLIGAVAIVAVLALVVGFWRDSDQMMQVGLLLTSGVWFARFVYTALDPGIFTGGSALLSLSWVIASVGAFMLEHFTGADPVPRRRDRV